MTTPFSSRAQESKPLRLHRLTGFGLGGILLCSGCANPGPPKPPSLNLPEPAKNLQAERIGDTVHLTWTTSDETTDGVPVKQPLSAEICRDLPPLPAAASPRQPAAAPLPCTVVARVATRPGSAAATDTLPAPLLHDPVTTVTYRVRLLNPRGRSADPSSPAFTLGGAAPAPVADLRLLRAPGHGTRLLWRPAPSPAASVFLLRSPADLPAPLPPSGNPGTSPAAPGKPPGKPPVPVRLLGAPEGNDPGGTLDSSSPREGTVRYVAWRVRTVTLDGRTLSARSSDSAPLTVALHDRTPPATPLGLQAVADGPAVDLSWEPGAEPDLGGYRVERRSGEAEPWQPASPSLLTAPSFRDHPPAGASTWFYRVLAVDSAGNASQPSAPVAATLRPAP